MRFASMVLACCLILGCSSDDEAGPTGPTVNACKAAGGVCAANFPFLCAPGDEPATDPSRATACGKSIGENPRDVPCCLRAPILDSGTIDTGAADAMTDAPVDTTVSDGSTDGATDATPDVSDATDGG
jgi:hypothetical protein